MNNQSEDLQAILNSLSKEAKTHKKQIFSLLWIVDNKSLMFLSAANGELKATYREQKPNADAYEYQFKDYDDFLIMFSRLEFILEQLLNLLTNETPTTIGFIRTSHLTLKLGFRDKISLIKEFQPDTFEGILQTLQNLQELRNILAHNPVPVGVYRGNPLDTKDAMLAIERDFSICFNHLVEAYRNHQYKLLNFIKT